MRSGNAAFSNTLMVNSAELEEHAEAKCNA
jgi:hypothetical protein